MWVISLSRLFIEVPQECGYCKKKAKYFVFKQNLLMVKFRFSCKEHAKLIFDGQLE